MLMIGSRFCGVCIGEVLKVVSLNVSERGAKKLIIRYLRYF